MSSASAFAIATAALTATPATAAPTAASSILTSPQYATWSSVAHTAPPSALATH